MRTLFVGPICDLSGFAHAGRSMLQALNHDKMDLVVRPLKYDMADPGTEYKVEPWLVDLLKRPMEGIDLLIQSTTPNIEANPKPGICNGIYTFIETDRIPQYWTDRLNLFDFVLVSSRYNATAMLRCGVTKPILVIPVPFDLDRLEEMSDESIIDAGDRTVFYNICQLSTKKGIDCLLRAYYAAFADRPDEVLLVLKTYINMASREHDRQVILQFIEKIKVGTRLPLEKWPPVQVITKTMTDADINRLHRECDVYVNSSRTEGFCLPAFSAMAHGNVLISNAHGGMAEFVTDGTALVYGGTISHCFDMPSGDPLQFTGCARWFEPSTAHMSDLMLLYHQLKRGQEAGELTPENLEQWESVKKRCEQGRKVAEQFDYHVASGRIAHQIRSAFDSWKKNGVVAFDQAAAAPEQAK